MIGTMEQLMKKADLLIQRLDFDGCEELFDKLPNGHPMMDLIFDRMEQLDPERFDRFLG